ncbi:MAG: alpha/beta fold hydrolase [Deltaproteobacteria bacterium]|nr:alpha/beta fold hydrolase [Deltaproteobacteria bacterium]
MDREKIAFALMTPTDLTLGAAVYALKAAGLKDAAGDKTYAGVRALLAALLKKNNDLTAEGLERLPAAGGVVIASNHQSWNDVQAIVATCPRRIHFMSKSEFARWPVLRRLIDLADAPYIRRGGDHEGLQRAIDFLQQGRVLGIFPEGTIPGEEDIMRHAVEPTTGLLRGHTGAVRLAISARVPIVPVGVSGTGASLPPEIYPRLELLQLPKSAPVTVRYGEPISYEQYHGQTLAKAELRRLTDELMHKISALVDHGRGYVPITVPVPPLPRYNRVGVLLLHGFTSSVKTVTGILPRLEALKLEVQVPVLRGHGTVYTDLKGVTSADWYADAERALLELAAKVDKVVVVGLSMGGLVAINLGIFHPDKIAGIVTWAAALRFVNPGTRFASALSRVVKSVPMPDAFNDTSLRGTCENYPRCPTDALASLYDYAVYTEARLAELKTPIAILHSKRDQVIEPVAANVIYRDIGSPHREIHWFKESGHEMGQDLEAAAVFDTTTSFIERFIKR